MKNKVPDFENSTEEEMFEWMKSMGFIKEDCPEEAQEYIIDYFKKYMGK